MGANASSPHAPNHEQLERNKIRRSKMDRLRRSLRSSLRKKKDLGRPAVTEAAKPHQWQDDELNVRAGTCSFPVKYLGCIEVFESRGMSVCEEALKHLRHSRRRPIKGMLYVSGDGIRVVDDDTKGLIVDQTIEKVSFCAPDRNHERGFSYICRDGTTRRWICHGFLALRDSGERLSHAVGCAFAVCLERKQKRDKECCVTMTFDPATSTMTRMGSFRTVSLTERIVDPQECKPAEPPPPKKDVVNPHAIARPHATPSMLLRQGSFRGFTALNQVSPFKRQLSLRLDELPSTLERAQQIANESQTQNKTSPTLPSPSFAPQQPNGNNGGMQLGESPQPPPRTRMRLMSLPNTSMTVPGGYNFLSAGPSSIPPIPESSPVHSCDKVSELAQQVSQGLSLLTAASNRDSNAENQVPFRPIDTIILYLMFCSLLLLWCHAQNEAENSNMTTSNLFDNKKTDTDPIVTDPFKTENDPFNADWAFSETNPFANHNTFQTFQLQM
ncbi:unnamed protein product [Darwinula stevensoni]|uniref:PID domain-containing protein n=1 Tax=Darwinula stevensoni TaxID=69355 RepID=A0A7R9A4D5_9CRUS|nr:unnamed protein product [Darwinula stevensoni]CAG0884056.1 unnamed protein product [Darwinula stevensoni]